MTKWPLFPRVYIVLSCKYWNFLLYILLMGGDCVVLTSPWSVTFQYWISDLYPEDEDEADKNLISETIFLHLLKSSIT